MAALRLDPVWASGANGAAHMIADHLFLGYGCPSMREKVSSNLISFAPLKRLFGGDVVAEIAWRSSQDS
jgi:hypothetical protein